MDSKNKPLIIGVSLIALAVVILVVIMLVRGRGNETSTSKFETIDDVKTMVKSIYKDFIIVKMITNNDFIIQGFGKNELGILKYDDNKLIFSSNENLNINDEIYISNLTGYNEKIVLGTIKGIIYTPEKVYEIKPVDINKIDYLVVLSRNKQWY